MEMWVVGWASSSSSSEAGRIDPKRVRNPTNAFTTLQTHPIGCRFLLVTTKRASDFAVAFPFSECTNIYPVTLFVPRVNAEATKFRKY